MNVAQTRPTWFNYLFLSDRDQIIAVGHTCYVSDNLRGYLNIMHDMKVSNKVNSSWFGSLYQIRDPVTFYVALGIDRTFNKAPSVIVSDVAR